MSYREAGATDYDDRPLVFLSYSRDDSPWKDKVTIQFRVLERHGRLRVWDDSNVGLGEEWWPQIREAMEAASVAVLLISAHFLTSDFILEREVPFLLERNGRDGLPLVPLLVSSCPWKEVEWLDRIQLFTGTDEHRVKPLDSLEDHEQHHWLSQMAGKVAHLAAGQKEGTNGDRPISVSDRQRLGEGLGSLTGLLGRPEVRVTVELYREHLSRAHEQVRKVADYKRLHDLLHGLRSLCYEPLFRELRRARKAGEATLDPEALTHAVLQLESVLRRLRGVLEDSSVPTEETAWVDRLEELLHEMERAGESLEPSAALRPVQSLRHILDTQLPWTDLRLVAAVEHLDLEALEKTLSRLNEEIGDLEEGERPVDDRLEEDLRHLAELSTRLSDLAREHHRWQELDSVLRRVDGATSAGDLDELAVAWPDLSWTLGELVGGRDEEWAQALQRASARLARALDARDPAEQRRAFQRYRGRAGDRFYQVDLALKDGSEELRSLDEPLGTLVRGLG